MERKLLILLVEDDRDICAEIISYVDTLDDVLLIGVTNNSDKAILYLNEYQPDAVILDLGLHEGFGSGIKFLQDNQNNTENANPYILVTTNNSSKVTYDIVRKLGADYIMFKHQNGYTSKTPVDFLRSMKDIIKSNTVKKAVVTPSKEDTEKSSKELRRKIATNLDCVGISQKSVGYNYLIDAIELIIDKPQPNICAVLAERYGKSDSSVERAMQKAITRAWRTTDIEDLLTHYTAKISSDKGVPTLTEFIYYYANKLKNNF